MVQKFKEIKASGKEKCSECLIPFEKGELIVEEEGFDRHLHKGCWESHFNKGEVIE